MAFRLSPTNEDQFRELVDALRTALGGGWAKLHSTLGFEKNRLERWHNKELANLRPDEFEKVFNYISYKADVSLRRKTLNRDTELLIDEYRRAKSRFTLASEMNIDTHRQNNFFLGYGLRFLTLRRASQETLSVGLMRIFPGIADEQSVPRFFSWRTDREDGRLGLKGFVLEDQQFIYLNGYILGRSQIWSAIYNKTSSHNDLAGHHLSVDDNRANIVTSKNYCINLKTLRSEKRSTPHDEESVRKFKDLIGLRKSNEIFSSLEPMLATSRLNYIKVFLD